MAEQRRPGKYPAEIMSGLFGSSVRARLRTGLSERRSVGSPRRSTPRPARPSSTDRRQCHQMKTTRATLELTWVSLQLAYEPTIGFSRAVRVGDRVLVAGTTPIWRDGSVDPDPEAQARSCIEITLTAI